MTTMTTLTPCTWSFWTSDSDPEFPGYSDGTTWNGFDNIYVTPSVHRQVIASLADSFDAWLENEETIQDMLAMQPGPDGLISYANGFATVAVDMI